MNTKKYFYESYEILENPFCCKAMQVFISPRLSLCVYYNLYGCFTNQGTKASIAFDVIPGISTMTVYAHDILYKIDAAETYILPPFKYELLNLYFHGYPFKTIDL